MNGTWWNHPVFTEWNNSLWENTLITLYMTVGTMLAAVIIGIPMGMLLHATAKNGLAPASAVNRVLGAIVNIGRSFPFIILIIALLPVTALIVGRSTGPTAAIVPLAVAAIPFLARLVEINLREVDRGKIEAVLMMGASRREVMTQVLLREALPGIIGSLTTTTIAVIGYTAMAGTVGGRGLGDLAYQRGYYAYDNVVIIAVVIVLLILVVLIQVAGDRLARAVDHRAQA